MLPAFAGAAARLQVLVAIPAAALLLLAAFARGSCRRYCDQDLQTRGGTGERRQQCAHHEQHEWWPRRRREPVGIDRHPRPHDKRRRHADE